MNKPKPDMELELLQLQRQRIQQRIHAGDHKLEQLRQAYAKATNGKLQTRLDPHASR